MRQSRVELTLDATIYKDLKSSRLYFFVLYLFYFVFIFIL